MSLQSRVLNSVNNAKFEFGTGIIRSTVSVGADTGLTTDDRTELEWSGCLLQNQDD